VTSINRLEYHFIPSTDPSPFLTVVIHGRGGSLDLLYWVPNQFDIRGMNYLFFNGPDAWETGYSWYDIAPNQGPGIRRSRELLFAELEAVARCRGFRFEDMFLFGFSQGCVMNLDIGLRFPHAFRGVVGSSGYLFFRQEYPEAFSPSARQQHFLVTHGVRDELLSFDQARQDADFLREQGCNVTFRDYDKRHTIDKGREISDVRDFIVERMEHKGP
jgi:phospholipase/carboxylesterase